MNATETWSRIGRHLAGESTAAEDAELERWAAEDPAHEELLAAARRIWEAAGGHLPGHDSGAAWRRLERLLSGASDESGPPVEDHEGGEDTPPSTDRLPIEPIDCAIRMERRPRAAVQVARRFAAGLGVGAAAALVAGLSLGWELLFVDTSLSYVAAEISAAFGIPLQLVSAATDEPRVPAVPEVRPFDGAVATVCRVLGSRCDEAPDQTTVYWTSGGR